MPESNNSAGPPVSGSVRPGDLHSLVPGIIQAVEADQASDSLGSISETSQPRSSQSQLDVNALYALTHNRLTTGLTSSSTPHPATEADESDGQSREQRLVQEGISLHDAPHSLNMLLAAPDEERVLVSGAHASPPVHVDGSDNARSLVAPGDEASGSLLPDPHVMVDRNEEMEDLSQKEGPQKFSSEPSKRVRGLLLWELPVLILCIAVR